MLLILSYSLSDRFQRFQDFKVFIELQGIQQSHTNINNILFFRRKLGRHFRDTMKHPRSYEAAASFSLPYPTWLQVRKGDALIRQLRHHLGDPTGLRLDI